MLQIRARTTAGNVLRCTWNVDPGVLRCSSLPTPP